MSCGGAREFSNTFVSGTLSTQGSRTHYPKVEARDRTCSRQLSGRSLDKPLKPSASRAAVESQVDLWLVCKCKRGKRELRVIRW